LRQEAAFSSISSTHRTDRAAHGQYEMDEIHSHLSNPSQVNL